MAVADELYLDNDYFIEVGPLAGLQIADGEEALSTGWLNLKAKICATSDWDASPIHSSLEVTLTEQGVTAIYRGGFEGSNLSAHLDNVSYLNLPVFLHIYRLQDYHIVSEVTVRQYRTVA